jgi:hypothetical protein
MVGTPSIMAAALYAAADVGAFATMDMVCIAAADIMVFVGVAHIAAVISIGV